MITLAPPTLKRLMVSIILYIAFALAEWLRRRREYRSKETIYAR
ncbi:MAG TPA: hypothetical protein VK206_01995 [Anaerolineales bacterium]|nr:hypothetical protein [Anaerolineales bacterium]